MDNDNTSKIRSDIYVEDEIVLFFRFFGQHETVLGIFEGLLSGILSFLRLEILQRFALITGFHGVLKIFFVFFDDVEKPYY